MARRGIHIDYAALLDAAPGTAYDDLAERSAEILPPLWQKAYRKMAQSPTSIHPIAHNGFHLLFDRASELVARDVIPGERAVEDRILVAYGRSSAGHSTGRNIAHHKLLGDAAVQFGEGQSRPYLPGSVLGGSFDISLYPQHRDLDSERSSDGRAYRAMAKYCAEHPKTFCFSRLIYTSRSWCPTAIEHGLLRRDGSFWIRRFRNAPMESKLPLLVRTLTGRTVEATSTN
jgi:hypothetical protein